jgi:inosine-uridine nucleoside N-ribohydrolase
MSNQIQSQNSVQGPHKVIIDCDPGHDDVFAIGLAASFCNILGITTVVGNSIIENTTTNALIAADVFGLHNVPVLMGAKTPLSGNIDHVTQAHGASGLDGPGRRTPHTKLDSRDAVDFLVETCRNNEGIWIVAIGPLTNVALAIRADHTLIDKIAGISLMGGSITHGNVTAAAEYNIWFDPQAAAEVFDSGARIKMCGLDLTDQLTVTGKFASDLKAIATDASQFCGELIDYYQGYAAKIAGATGPNAALVGAPLHDPCAVLALTHPELFTSERMGIQVETAGTHTLGMTLADTRPWENHSSSAIEVMQTIKANEARQIIVDSFKSQNK